MSESMEKMVREARIDHAIEKRKAPRVNFAHAIREAMAEADKAQTHRAHTPPGMHEPTAYIPTRPVRSLPASLNSFDLPALFGADGRLRRAPGAAPAGNTIRLDTGVAASSRVARAGAHVIVVSDNRKAHAVGATGHVALESVNAEFRTIEAAVFGVVDIEAEGDAPIIALPVFGASMDMRQLITKGVRFEIPRSERRRVDSGQLADEISIALTLGIARAADEALMAAITTTNPAAFSLGAAAAQGLQFDELRALVGAAGIGAVVGQDGALRAAGVPAELTGDMAGTLIGAWNRSGVAIGEDIPVHFERLGKAGELAVTAWVTVLPLLPDKAKFWSLA